MEIRERQAHLSRAPIVRLKLIFEEFNEGSETSGFRITELIMKKIRENRLGKFKLDHIVTLPFLEDDDNPPYRAEIARVVSIEFLYSLCFLFYPD